MSLSWTNLNAAAAVIWEKSNLRTMVLTVGMPSVQTSLQRAWYCNLGGWWRFCAAKLGSCWFKHNTETAKQSPGNQGILPTQKSENSKLFSDFIISLKLTDTSSRLHGLISLLQKPKRLKRDYILIVVSPGYTESGNPGHWLTRILMLPFKSRHNRYKEQESRPAFSESTQWSVFMCPNPNAQMQQDVSNI